MEQDAIVGRRDVLKAIAVQEGWKQWQEKSWSFSLLSFEKET